MKQNQLDAIDVVSDLPSVSHAAGLLGSLSWAVEQTGCKLTIHQGITGDQTVVLKDGIISKFKTAEEALANAAAFVDRCAEILSERTARKTV